MSPHTAATVAQQLRDQLNDQGLIVREVAATLAAAESEPDLMQFDAQGVPWDQVIEHWFGRECFAAGSVELHPNGTKVLWSHREPIGKVSAGQSTAAGYGFTGQLSDTATARDVWTLMKDGVIDRCSIGFEPHEYTYDEDQDLLTWTRVTAREFSLVPFPAYDDTPVSNLRTSHTKKEPRLMPAATQDTTRDDLVALTAELAAVSAELDDLKRGVAMLGSHGPAASIRATASRWTTMGAFLKDLARGDDEAAEFHRAYTGGTTADSTLNETFIGAFVQLVKSRRRVTSQFGTKPLPDKGMSMDYYQLKADTTQIGKQATEGADLLKGKVTLQKANAPIDTYGGWTELSMQEVERAPLPILDTTLTALGITYGRVTETASRLVLETQVTAGIAAGAGRSVILGAALAAATPDQWLATIINAAEIYEDQGFMIEGLDVSKDVFLQITKLADAGGRRLFNVYGSADQPGGIGRVELGALTGNLAGVPITCVPKLSAGIATFYDSVAIDIYESPNAPAQLQDTNVVNLSKQFSLYGYAAQVVPFPQAIVPIKLAAS